MFYRRRFLAEEFSHIFSDIVLRDSVLYKKIVKSLASGSKTQQEVQKALKLETPGRLHEYLSDLELAGFVARDYSWDLSTGEDIKKSKYRLKDNYLRYYLKYIDKKLDKMKRGLFTLNSLTALPEWHTMMGLQFENLVLNNRKAICDALGINASDVINDNPFFRKKTTRLAGVQIDYMIQTKFDTLYICEIKFSKLPVGIAVIEEVQRKIDALQTAKRFSCRPVLLHVNGVSADLQESDYFAAIMNLGSLLGESSH